MPKTTKKEPELDFENSLLRLEEIIGIIEDTDTKLESTMTLYKEGLALSKSCAEMLGKFETEITALKQGPDGVLTLTPFIQQ